MDQKFIMEDQVEPSGCCGRPTPSSSSTCLPLLRLLHKKTRVKVPQITMQFWIIKVCCTTVGETFADFLTNDAGLGEGGTLGLMGACLLLVLAGQFYVDRYYPWLYWLTVILLSIEGTLITDCVHDYYNVALWVTTVIFGSLMFITFYLWYLDQHTLDIHSIYDRRRESWYWLAILWTFACGTAFGDLLSSFMGSLWLPFLVFSLWIGSIALVWYFKILPRLSGGQIDQESATIFLFWFAYVMTRPLGASIGDGLSHEPTSAHTTDDPGPGAGLGLTWTNVILAFMILSNLLYLTLTKKDVVVVLSSHSSQRGAAAVAGGGEGGKEAATANLQMHGMVALSA